MLHNQKMEPTVGVIVQKLLILLCLGFLVGNAFAGEQPDAAAKPKDEAAAKPKDDAAAKPKDEAAEKRPVKSEGNKAALVSIKASDMDDSAKAWVSEMLVYRGAWVQAGKVVAILTTGEKDIYIKSPDTGVVMKVPVKRGDSVSQGAVLAQLKKVNAPRPDFQRAWKYFSLVNAGVPAVGKRLGGKVKQNINLPGSESGKWNNACTIRMSFVLNNTGFPIKNTKYSTVTAQIEGLYIYRVEEMISYLRDVFGDPDIVVNRVPSPDDFSFMKGILVVTGDGRSDARGHITLWNGSTCSDVCHLAGDENNNTFKPIKAALWVLP